MLDSTGMRESVSVCCANCGRKIYFTKYTPQHGHDGGVLNVGSCITKDSTEIQEVNLYLICIKDGEIVSNKFHLEESIESYHHNGFKIPAFGFYPGQVMYICSSCDHCMPSAVATKKISHVIEELVCRVALSKYIEISFMKKSRKKRVLLEDKLSVMLKKLSQTNKALKKLYPTL